MEQKEELSQPERFKIARDYVKMNQEEIEKLIGLSRTSISKHETTEQPKPNVHYVLFLAEKGINPQWLICKSDEMLSSNNSNNISIKEVEELRNENKSLKDELNALRREIKEQSQELKQFLGTINLLSGKPSEHKKAANPNVKKNNSLSGWSYAPAS